MGKQQPSSPTNITPMPASKAAAAAAADAVASAEKPENKKFVSASREVIQRSRIEKIYMTGGDFHFDKKKMLKWFADKNADVTKWSKEDRDSIFEHVSGKFCECAGKRS